MRFITLLSAVLAVGLIAGCGGGSAPPSTDLSGNWFRSASVPGSNLFLMLQVNGTQVTGNGSYAIEAGRSGSLQIQGTVNGNTFHLTFQYDYGPTAVYDGQISDFNDLNGTLQQTGDPASPTHFLRQDPLN